MIRTPGMLAAVGCAAMLAACSNTVNGPARLFSAGNVSSLGNSAEEGAAGRRCPTSRPPATPETPINLSREFYDLACVSLREPNDPSAAKAMMDHGVTLNRIRCNDFFAQRAGNQMRGRIARGTVAPVSALITGIIGVATFDTEGDRLEAIQILGLGQSAAVAGLDLFESEFLFGSANINSVRALTMRALDEHAAGILAQEVRFHGAARHLIDHQMICTPANILALSQTAIREGHVVPRTAPDPQIRNDGTAVTRAYEVGIAPTKTGTDGT